MRLLHTTNLVLKEFLDNKTPRYAILSHRWEEDEVDLQNFHAIRRLEDPRYKEFAEFLKLSMTVSEDCAGYRKIQRCCEKAASEGYDWVWIDTCCIDKTSSAELTEAINSMYIWYKNAAICYAYLSDVSAKQGMVLGELSERDEKQLEASQWFTRGWTLQELIAPPELLFLDRDWLGISHKSDISDILERITKIPAEILTNPAEIYWFSVAQRMSWAAHRQTSRIEDSAYCLMGLFEVNMPLLYGEGNKAFRRLQEEILRTSDDDSIFAWSHPQNLPWSPLKELRLHGLLAVSPDLFEDSGDVILPNIESHEQRRPYQLTNKGLEWEVSIFRLSEPQRVPGYDTNHWQVPLQCLKVNGRHNRKSHLSLVLRAWDSGPVNNYGRFDRKLLLEGLSEPLRPGQTQNSTTKTILVCLNAATRL